MVRSNKTRDPPAQHHSAMLTLKGVHPSRRDAALKPVDLQGQPTEAREPPRTARQEPIHLRKERARLRGVSTRWRTAARGPQPEETELGPGASAAPPLPWNDAGSVH